MNSNCLDGMACPKCGHAETLFITVTVRGTATVTDDGYDHGDLDDAESWWDEDDPCQCSACNFAGEVGEFKED